MFITKIICMLVDKWVISGAVNSFIKKLREAPLPSLLNANHSAKFYNEKCSCCKENAAQPFIAFLTLKFFLPIEET